MWSGLERQVTKYWVTHVVNLEQQNSDEETKSWLPNLKEVAADPKQRSHGMSGRIVQQIHVRSLFSLLVGTAVRDGSLYSAYSRTQTGRFEFSAWYPKRERRQQLKQSKRHYNGDWSNADMGSKNGKNNRLGLRSAWMHLEKESLNNAVQTMTVFTKSRISLRRQQRTELQKSAQLQSNKQQPWGLNLRIQAQRRLEKGTKNS